MLKDLVKLANDLDAKGLRAEADYLDGVIRKWAGDLQKMASLKAHFRAIIKRDGPEEAKDWAKYNLSQIEDNDFIEKEGEYYKAIKELGLAEDKERLFYNIIDAASEKNIHQLTIYAQSLLETITRDENKRKKAYEKIGNLIALAGGPEAKTGYEEWFNELENNITENYGKSFWTKGDISGNAEESTDESGLKTWIDANAESMANEMLKDSPDYNFDSLKNAITYNANQISEYIARIVREQP